MWQIGVSNQENLITHPFQTLLPQLPLWLNLFLTVFHVFNWTSFELVFKKVLVNIEK